MAEITTLDDFRVVAIAGEGVAIVDSAGHYWLAYPDSICQARREDALATAYRKATT